MADVTYSVEVQYLTKGNLVSVEHVRNAKRQAEQLQKEAARFGDSMKSSIQSFTSGFNSAFDSLASRAASTFAGIATAASAAFAGAFALGFREMMRFNEETENSIISMAAISNATGESSNMAQGLRIASSTVQQMRKDAALLPGSFTELQKTITMIMPALGHAGVGTIGAEGIGAKVMAAAKIEGIAPDVAAREFAALVEGRATTRMPLFSKMLPLLAEYGITDTKSFNALDMKKRLELANAGVTKVTGNMNDPYSAIGVFSRSWNAIKETAVDNIRMALGSVGGDLFERIKDKVSSFNDIKSGKRGLAVIDKFVNVGEHISSDLVKGFDKAFEWGEKIWKSDWIPMVRSFGQELAWGIKGAMHHISPMLDFLRSHARKFMMDPLAYEKLAHAAKTMLALRVGSGMLGSASGMLPTLVTAFGGGSAGVGALAGAAVPALGVIAALALAADGAVHAITDANSAFHNIARSLSIDIMRQLGDTGKNLEEIWHNIEPLRDALGVGLLFAVKVVTGWLESLTEIVKLGTGAFRSLFDYIRQNLPGGKDPHLNDEEDDTAAMLEEARRTRPPLFMNKVFEANALAEREGKNKVPNHTTHIHRVEIKVNSNQDPNRIAKRTLDILSDLARHPRSYHNSGNPSLTRP